MVARSAPCPPPPSSSSPCILSLLVLITSIVFFVVVVFSFFFLSPSQGSGHNSESILIFSENTEPHAGAGTHISTPNHTEEGISWESDVSRLLGFRVNIYRLPPSEKKKDREAAWHPRMESFPKSFEFFFFSSKPFPSRLSHQLSSLPLVLLPASSNPHRYIPCPPSGHIHTVSVWTHRGAHSSCRSSQIF